MNDYKTKYLKYKTKYLNLTTNKKMNMIGGKAHKNTLYLFKADWCPHCISFLPTWKKMQAQLGGTVKFVTYDSELNKNEISKYKIDGFPTVILTVDDKAIEYVGSKDENSLKEFINQYNN